MSSQTRLNTSQRLKTTFIPHAAFGRRVVFASRRTKKLSHKYYRTMTDEVRVCRGMTRLTTPQTRRAHGPRPECSQRAAGLGASLSRRVCSWVGRFVGYLAHEEGLSTGRTRPNPPPAIHKAGQPIEK